MDSRTMRGGARLLALACSLLTMPLEAQSRSALTLEQAVNEAIENNLQLTAERLQVPVAEAEMIGARLRPNPTITWQVDNLSAQRLFGTHPADTTDRTIAVGIPIETAGKRRLRIENASLGSRIAALQLEDAVRRLRLDVATAYSDALRARQRSQLAHVNAELLNDVVQVNAVRVKAGAAAQLELTRSQTAMYLLRSDAARADVDLATAQLHLANTLGRRTSFRRRRATSARNSCGQRRPRTVAARLTPIRCSSTGPISHPEMTATAPMGYWRIVLAVNQWLRSPFT